MFPFQYIWWIFQFWHILFQFSRLIIFITVFFFFQFRYLILQFLIIHFQFNLVRFSVLPFKLFLFSSSISTCFRTVFFSLYSCLVYFFFLCVCQHICLQIGSHTFFFNYIMLVQFKIRLSLKENKKKKLSFDTVSLGPKRNKWNHLGNEICKWFQTIIPFCRISHFRL